MSEHQQQIQRQWPLFRYERHPDEELGRCLVASTRIPKDRLVFVERPVIAMQSMGNVHTGALVCSYCMAFCGSPEQSLRVTADPSCLEEIATTSNAGAGSSEGDCDDPWIHEGTDDLVDDPHALYCCKNECGHIYCSLECRQDDWEWGGHKELCTGEIPDPDEPNTNETEDETTEQSPPTDLAANNESNQTSTESIDQPEPSYDPLFLFKVHARETNEIFLLVAMWLIRILKHNIPYHEDDNQNAHPYTDFQMNTWWDVKNREQEMMEITGQTEDNNDENQITTDSLETVLKQLCRESHAYLSKSLKTRIPSLNDSPWLTPVGMARLIGSLEQNCLGIRRKHPLQRDIMQDADLRYEFHAEVIRCLEGAGMIGDSNEDSDDNSLPSDNNDESPTFEDETLVEPPPTDDSGDACADPSDPGIDEESKNEEDLGYTPDEITTFLASLTQDLTSGSVYDDWDEVFPPLDGISHYSIATKMNHSCDPNVIIVYKTRGWGRDHPLCAYIVALRDIAPGDELTISYIDSDDPFEKRQAALANYGFVCKCAKCQREKEEIDGRPVQKSSEEEDDLFGGDDENEDLFGEDEEESDNDDDGQPNQGDEDDRVLQEDHSRGEDKLLSAVERLDSILNKSSHAAIPLMFLAQTSSYVIKQVSSLLTDIRKSEEFEDDDKTIENLLEQNKDAVKDRDFAACRIVGSDLELYLYNILECNGAWATPMHRASYWCAAITASIGYANEGSFLVAMKFLDKATILGQDRMAISYFFEYVELHASQMAAAPCPVAIECTVSDFCCPKLKDTITSTGLSKPILFPVPECVSDNTSEESHLSECLQKSQAFVIRNLALEWPAKEKWRKMDLLAREFSHRLVPVEIGSMTSGMKEAVSTFRSFVAKYLSVSAKKDSWSLDDAVSEAMKKQIAYLAQHPLLDQIPALSKDLDMCPCGVKPTNVNVWMGTGGTRTPLHFDSYDNLLVQIVGAKYVRLYDKECTPQLYVRKDTSYGGQGNMSELDCELEDFEKHPLAKECEYREVLLFPGDCLFIPARQWHYVRSLSTSVSVNYWF